MLTILTRQAILITLLAAICLSVVSCDKGSDSKKSVAPEQKSESGKIKPLICVSLLTMTNPFFKDMADTLQTEGEKRGYEVTVTAGEFDAARQRGQIQDFLVKKPAAIILAPCDSKSVGTSIQEANKAHVPVFTADIACLADGAKVVGHCGTDNFEGGRIAGKAIVAALNGKGKVAMLDQPELETGLMRENGCLEEIAKAPGIEVVAKLPSHGSRDGGHTATKDLIQSHPDVDAIFCVNDPTALGVIAALEEAGKLDRVKVIGFDGQKEARQAVKDGKLFATVMQYPRKIASTTVDDIAKYLAGEDVAPKTLLPPTLYLAADATTDSELK